MIIRNEVKGCRLKANYLFVIAFYLILLFLYFILFYFMYMCLFLVFICYVFSYPNGFKFQSLQKKPSGENGQPSAGKSAFQVTEVETSCCWSSF